MRKKLNRLRQMVGNAAIWQTRLISVWHHYSSNSSILENEFSTMERRMSWKVHIRCEVGENLEITSKSYLSLCKIGATAMAASQLSHNQRKTFNVILCPSHVVGKWSREISETLPDTAGVVVRSTAKTTNAPTAVRFSGRQLTLSRKATGWRSAVTAGHPGQRRGHHRRLQKDGGHQQKAGRASCRFGRSATHSCPCVSTSDAKSSYSAKERWISHRSGKAEKDCTEEQSFGRWKPADPFRICSVGMEKQAVFKRPA